MQETKDNRSAYKPFNMEKALSGDKVLVLSCIAEYKFSYCAKVSGIGDVSFYVFLGEDTGVNNSSDKSHITLTLTEEELNKWAVMLPKKTTWYIASYPPEYGGQVYRCSSDLYRKEEDLIRIYDNQNINYIIHEIEIEE